MSFKIVEQAPARLNRSELAVPGSNPTFMEKAAASAADVVFLDLEDAVAPDDKPQARKNIIEALRLALIRLALIRLALIRLALIRLALIRLALIRLALIRLALIRLAKQYGCYGYRNIGKLLRIEGWTVNHNKVERLWREEGLQLPQRHKKRKRLYHKDGSVIRLRLQYPNHVWSVDFVRVTCFR